MLQFEVYKDGRAVDELDLSGALVFGQDRIPVRADLTFADGKITCIKRSPGACGLALCWEAGRSGRVVLSTTRLPERDQPYVLSVELVRGHLARMAQKLEDWGLYDFASAQEHLEEFRAVRDKFIESLKQTSNAEASRLAVDALDQAVTLGEKLALFHAEILLSRRRSVRAVRFGCRLDLFSMSEGYNGRINEAMDFVSIPTPWKHTEPKEHQYHWTQIDQWITWAAKNRRRVHAGPLVSFETNQIPEWIYIWEHDYEALRDLIYEHVQKVVRRYAKQVRVWNVVSGIHACNSFNLTFDQLMELTRMSCLLVKKLAPKSQVMIDLAMPFGEYYARNQRTIPPMLYADMAVQSGVKFDAFGLQILQGVGVEGHYVRDLMQLSDLVDELVSLGKSIHITSCQVPSDASSDTWDHWSGEHEPAEGGMWHSPWSQRLQAEWLQAFARVAISKPYVESLCWQDLADYEGHFLPHGGLCKNNMEPKLAFTELKNFRAKLAGQAASANASATSTPKNPPAR
jgi:hypothetical protein